MNNTKSLNGAQQVAREPSPAAVRPKRRWRLAVFLLLLLAASTGVSFVLFRYVLPSVPRELVGTWEVTDGALKGAQLEFRWYGLGVATTVKHGRAESLESAVKVKGKRIYMTSKNPTGRDDTLIQTIIQLTPRELVIRDQDDITYHLVRIAD